MAACTNAGLRHHSLSTERERASERERARARARNTNREREGEREREREREKEREREESSQHTRRALPVSGKRRAGSDLGSAVSIIIN